VGRFPLDLELVTHDRRHERGAVQDPFGHKWMFSTHKEDVDPKEMERRGKQWVQDMQKRTGPTQ